jgi:hypothetical protein
MTSGVRAARTKHNYRWAFNYFLKYLKITDPSSLVEKDPRILESMIIEFATSKQENEAITR